MKKIQLFGTEEDLDNGFYEIMTSGESSGCAKNETYFVKDGIVKKLKEQKIKFKIL